VVALAVLCVVIHNTARFSGGSWVQVDPVRHAAFLRCWRLWALVVTGSWCIPYAGGAGTRRLCVVVSVVCSV